MRITWNISTIFTERGDLRAATGALTRRLFPAGFLANGGEGGLVIGLSLSLKSRRRSRTALKGLAGWRARPGITAPWNNNEYQFAARGASRTALAISFCRSNSCRRRWISSGER